MPSAQGRKPQSSCLRPLVRRRKCFRACRPKWTVASGNASRSYQGRGQCDSRSPPRRRSVFAASHFSGVERAPDSPASSTVGPPTGRTFPGSSAREPTGLVPASSTPRPFREVALPLVFQSLVVSASPSPHSKYSSPRMLSCGGGGDDGGGAAGESASSEFFRIDLTL